MAKKIIYLLPRLLSVIILGLTLLPAAVWSQRVSHPVTVYFFRGEGCPHCAAEEIFLEKIKTEFSNVSVRDFEIWYDRKNAQLAETVVSALGIRSGGVPLTIVGENVINGFLNEATTGAEIRRAIERYTTVGDPDVVSKIINNESAPAVAVPEPRQQWPTTATPDDDGVYPKSVAVPLLGVIDVRNVSLFGLTVALGLLDGFNPCAMWVLVFLISMLLGVPSRRRQWAIGLIFIMTSGFVYFIFMAAWLNLFLFIGFLFWIRLLIGAVAITSGVYQLREFFVNKNAACKVINPEKRQKISLRIKRIIQEKSLLLAFAGVIGLAAAVNMVELVCSAGLPAIYTSVLSAAGLATWQYYGYLIFYIILYMLDDFIVFAVAMVTLRFVGGTAKYVRTANLVGGTIILLLGILLIFKPGWVMFG